MSGVAGRGRQVPGLQAKHKKSRQAQSGPVDGPAPASEIPEPREPRGLDPDGNLFDRSIPQLPGRPARREQFERQQAMKQPDVVDIGEGSPLELDEIVDHLRPLPISLREVQERLADDEGRHDLKADQIRGMPQTQLPQKEFQPQTNSNLAPWVYLTLRYLWGSPAFGTAQSGLPSPGASSTPAYSSRYCSPAATARQFYIGHHDMLAAFAARGNRWLLDEDGFLSLDQLMLENEEENISNSI